MNRESGNDQTNNLRGANYMKLVVLVTAAQLFGTACPIRLESLVP